MRALAGAEVAAAVPGAEVLLPFAEALVTGEEPALAAAREAVVERLGAEVMVDAAGVAANFERMVRIADGTGIELGEFLESASAEVREALGIRRRDG